MYQHFESYIQEPQPYCIVKPEQNVKQGHVLKDKKRFHKGFETILKVISKYDVQNLTR